MMCTHGYPTRHGFTLVELSIVLVILGLLVGGVLTGQSLIRAAELRRTTNDLSRFNTAIYTFRDKYFSLPGDMPDATKYWGTDPNGCPSHAPTAALSATCNGDGNGAVDWNPTLTTEPYRFWQQLADAGLIEGSYNGVTGTASYNNSVAGVNVPKLAMGSNFGVSAMYIGNVVPSGSYAFPGSYGNVLIAGACIGYECADAAFKPEDTLNIDQKLDDGKPGTGRIRTRVGAGSNGGGTCNNAASDSYANAGTATYLLTETRPSCTIYYGGF